MAGNAADPPAGAGVTRRAGWATALLVAGSACIHPLVAHAQQAPGTIVGALVNRETRAPIEGARVAILGSSLMTSSDSAGRFRIGGVVPGVRVIQVRAIGYSVGSWLLQVDEGQTLRHEFEIEPRIYEISAVTVSARDPHDWRSEAGFERRSQRMAGYFIGRADIANRRATNVADLLRGVPGVYTTCRGRNCQVTMARSTRQCSPEYFLDGHPATFSTGPQFPINQIRGVEVYRSQFEVPPEFQRIGLRCGVIAIWTIEPGESLHRPPGRTPADSSAPGERPPAGRARPDSQTSRPAR